MKQSWLQAANVRTSRRTYQEVKMEPEQAARLRLMTEDCNTQGGLRIRFMENGSELFRSFKSGYGMLRGVQYYFAMAAEKSLPHRMEKLGYFGELLVLECTVLGLGTCWIAGTYDRAACREQIGLREDEDLACIITVGSVNQEKSLKEKAVSLTGKRRKPLSDWITPAQGLPDWVVSGVETARKAPSAMNGQPVRLVYENGKVSASVDRSEGTQGIDLGIAMAHFELGAWGAGTQGQWKLQNEQYIFEL